MELIEYKCTPLYTCTREKKKSIIYIYIYLYSPHYMKAARINVYKNHKVNDWTRQLDMFIWSKFLIQFNNKIRKKLYFVFY